MVSGRSPAILTLPRAIPPADPRVSLSRHRQAGLSAHARVRPRARLQAGLCGPTRGLAVFALAALVAALVLNLGCTPLDHHPRHTEAGVYHVVERGETLWKISRAYGVSVMEMIEANGLRHDSIEAGQKLFVPGATSVVQIAEAQEAAEPTRRTQGAPPGEARLSWPLAGRGRGSVTSGFGHRKDPLTGAEGFHQGADIGAPLEERVLAAGAGEIVFAGRQSGYGIVVMIDHGHRLITVYAHLSRAIATLEQKVERGQTIGYVGETGRASGCHLHFEVRHKGVPVDPLKYLP